MERMRQEGREDRQAEEQGGDKWDYTGVTDALANIMHICDEAGLDYAECEARARDHYLCEIDLTPAVVAESGANLEVK